MYDGILVHWYSRYVGDIVQSSQNIFSTTREVLSLGANSPVEVRPNFLLRSSAACKRRESDIWWWGRDLISIYIVYTPWSRWYDKDIASHHNFMMSLRQSVMKNQLKACKRPPFCAFRAFFYARKGSITGTLMPWRTSKGHKKTLLNIFVAQESWRRKSSDLTSLLEIWWEWESDPPCCPHWRRRRHSSPPWSSPPPSRGPSELHPHHACSR